MLLNEIFSLEEKTSFLKDIGYHINDNIATKIKPDGSYEQISNDTETVFLKEILIKFKNLLLAKSTLKLKL